MNLEFEANVEIEVEAPQLEIEIEVEAPELEIEVEIEVPQVEIEIEFEAPQVEIEVDLGIDYDVAVQEPIVEVEIEVGGSMSVGSPAQKAQKMLMGALSLTLLGAIYLTVGIILFTGYTHIYFYYWLVWIIAPALLILVGLLSIMYACKLKKSGGAISESLIDVEAGGNYGNEVQMQVQVEMPTVEVKMDVPQVEIEVEMDFSVDIEIDLGFDINVWGAKKQSPVAWTGYYVQGGARNDMALENLDIGYDGSIYGSGSDANGNFSIEGSMDTSGAFTFNKNYDSYSVIYQGQMAANSLTGTWYLNDQAPEEFSITLNSPSYTGWFAQGGDRNTMDLDLYVSGDAVFGTGSDAVGNFIIRGTYNEMSGECNFAKQYLGAHQVFYFGNCKDNGRVIRGKWTIPDNCDGKFMIKQR